MTPLGGPGYMGPPKGVMIGFSFLYYMFPNSKMSQKIPTMCFANFFSGDAPLQVQCGIVTQHLWLGDFGKCNRGLHARTLRLCYPKSSVTSPLS